MEKSELKKFYKQHNLNPKDVYSDDRGFAIITLSGIEKIQNQNDIKVGYEVICCEIDNVVFKAVSMGFDTTMGEFVPIIETFGSATKENCRNTFKAEIAEKRALARCVIKTMRFSNIKGEDEINYQPPESLSGFKS